MSYLSNLWTIISINIIILSNNYILSEEFEYNQSHYSKVYAKHYGDLYLAGLFSMNRDTLDGNCTKIIEQDGLQVLAATMYTIEKINNLKILPIKLGLLAIDTCQTVDYAITQSIDFLQFKMTNIQNSYICPNNDIPKLKEELEGFRNVFGIFGAGNSDVTIQVSSYLKLIKLPQLSYFSTSPALSDTEKFPTFFRTIPSDDNLILAIIQLLKRYRWYFLMILKDDSSYSNQTTKSFNDHLRNDKENLICVNETFTINEKYTKSINRNVRGIMKKVSKPNSPRVIITFLSQHTAEAFLEYTEEKQNYNLSNILWIGTDSWGGRHWENLNSNNSILNNAITLVPFVTVEDDFMNYYKKRMPSVIKSDPWLARAFEETCQCEYKNDNSFFILELNKMRTSSKASTLCQTIEVNCSTKFYKDVKQMPYIHYVIDGIYVYAYALKKLIPESCTSQSISDCLKTLREDILKIKNIKEAMQSVWFKDSTGNNFTFVSNSGVPKYTILYFNNTISDWDLSGTISWNTTGESVFVVNESLNSHILNNYKFPLCSSKCKSGQAQKTLSDCCWECKNCRENEIVVSSNISTIMIKNKEYREQICQQCNSSGIANRKQPDQCIEKNITLQYMSFNDDISLVMFVINIIGLMGCLTSTVVMIIYWQTPVIKAFGRETSTIILIGTYLGFIMSSLLLYEPQIVFCYVRYCSPGFCSTLCYAGILTKTNRIARIFNIKLSSKKNAFPRFISPLSQINIVMLITLIECIIMATVMATSDISVVSDLKITETINLKDCYKLTTSVLISIFIIPFVLLLSSTIYAYKIRKTPDGFNETRNLNFLNFTNCIVFITCILLYQILNSNKYSVIPLCLLMTLGSYSNLLVLFFPKIYIILFRPSKNTPQAINTKRRTRSQQSVSQSSSPSFGTHFQNPNLSSTRCRKCNLPMITSIELDTLSREHVLKEGSNTKPQLKVNFDCNSSTKHIISNIEVDSQIMENEFDNKAYNEDKEQSDFY